MANKDLQDQQNDLLKHMTADDPEDQQLGGDDENEDKIEFDETDHDADDDDEDEKPQKKQQRDSEDDDDEEDEKPQRRPPTGLVDGDDEDESRQSRFYFKADKAGNLLDKEGRILFTKGRARGIFTKVKEALEAEERKVANASAAFNKVTETARELLARYKELKEQNTQGKNLGLTDPEQLEALQMRAQMKLDPKAGLRKILTMLHMSGTDLTDLGITQPLDAKTVAEQVLAIQEAKKPKEKTAEDRAREEAVKFLQDFPAAKAHTALVVEAKEKYPHMTLQEIWFQILVHAQNPQNKPRDDNRRRPNGRDIPQNSQRSRPQNRNGKLSIAPVDPTQSFHQIGSQLKADLKALEE